MAKKPVKITEVVLRDAHQSLLATRMTMDEMRPILPEMDKIPYFSVECWGGATFDSCIRFLDEDPWERLRILRKELPHQKLQMLFRGQNMLGYRPYADDAVQYFVQKSVANGIDVIRIFDALNDPRNLKTAIEAANKEKAHVQACISYTLSPVHNNEYFAKYAKTLEEMGADSICIKDMAGLLKPYTCAELVSELKKTVSIPVDIHSHYTAGLASMSILKGIEAGADIVDTAMSPLALGTSHMPTESLVAALQGTDYDTGLDLNQLNVVRAYFAKLREKYIANGQINPKSLGVDANTLLYQVPGGMFSNMLKQLKDAGREDKLDEVLAEIPRVREDAGYPPLVTPTSQIVGTQAVFNVIMGERFGYWCDTGVRLQGPAAWSFATIFLELWASQRPDDPGLDAYREEQPFPAEEPTIGLVQPYSDSPVDDETVSKNVYLDLITQAQETLWITTPYLILDNATMTSLRLAAKRGVDVRIYTPGIPDKKMVYQLTCSYFEPLIRSGVKIYTFTPGFLHAKTWLVDGRIAVVGSINLDYRSLYLHFECAALLYGCAALADVGEFMMQLEKQSHLVELKECRTSAPGLMVSALLRLLAPLC